MKNKVKEILKEYFSVISPLLEYESNESSLRIEQEVLKLLCCIAEAEELVSECWEKVKEVACLQTAMDGILMENANVTVRSIIGEMKYEVLTENKVETLKMFDTDLFVARVKENAFLGDKDACKLLAVLKWIGLGLPEDKTVAVSIWEQVALSGDFFAIRALNYVNQKEDNGIDWTKVLEILESSKERFASIAKKSDYAEYKEEEVQLANLILCIRQKGSARNGKHLNLPLLYYMLHSKEEYEVRMSHLSAEQNYYLLLQKEEKYGNKKYGF